MDTITEPDSASLDAAAAAPAAAPCERDGHAARTAPVTRITRGVVVSPQQLRAVLDEYGRGQMLSAYALAQTYGPIQDWRGRGARVLAGRLAGNLGAPKLSMALHRLA